MAISAKFILRPQSTSKEENFPIMLQIVIDRKNRLVSTKKYCSKDHWLPEQQSVSKLHPKWKEVNLLLKTIGSEIDFLILSYGKEGKRPSFDEIKNLVRNLTGGHSEPVQKSLFEVFEEHIEDLTRQNRLGTKEAFVNTLNSLKKFTGNKDHLLSTLDLDSLFDYEEYLVKRGCAITSRSFYFRTFRTLWKLAIKKGYCPENHYPFKDFPFSKYNNPRTKKRAISKEQLEKIISTEIDTSKDTLINSRNYFLFSYYCRGLNFTDLAELKWKNIVDNELSYIRQKTGEEFRFRLHPEALRIINYYQNLEGNSDAGYIFPILYKRHITPQSIRDRKRKILKRVNKQMKELGLELGITKRITTYVARHTFATTLRQNGFSKEDIGKTFGHDSLKTTEIYLDDIGDPLLDEMINSTI